MNPRFRSVWLIVGLVAISQLSQTSAGTAQKVETVSLSDIQSGATNFDGRIEEAPMVFDKDGNEMPPKEGIFQEYGTRTFTAFEKHPEIVAALKKLNPKFNPHQMGTSQLSCVATIHGRTLLLLLGCFPHNCGETKQIAAFEPSTHQVYLLQPTNLGPDSKRSRKFNLSGNPDSSVRLAMCNAYLQ